MHARTEQIAVLAQVDELHALRFPHDELSAALDFLVVVRKPVGQRIARVIGPFDDVDELMRRKSVSPIGISLPPRGHSDT